MIKPSACLAGALVALLLGAATARSADEPGGKVTDVGVQQQRIQRGFQEFEQKVLQTLDGIRQKDPERAARLQAALDWAREKSLAGRMAGVAELLNHNRLAEAGERQAEMVADLAAMQQLLQDEPGEYERLRKQVARVQAWLNTTVELSREQWRLMRDSERAQDPSAGQQLLKEQIARAESLLAGQMELRKRTEQAQRSGAARLEEAVREQQQLEQEARALLAGIQRQGGGGAGDRSDRSDPPDPPDRPGQAGAGAGGAAQAGEAPRPMPQNPGQPPAPATRPPEAGEQLLALAIRSQMLATESLAAQKPHAAVTNQNQAIVKLEMALRELHFELARQQPPLDPLKAQAAQEALADKTAKLFNDMLQTAPRPPTNDPLLVAPTPPGEQGENPNSLPGTQPNLDSPYAQPPGAQQQMQGAGARNTAPDFAAGVNTGATAPPGLSHPQGLGTTTPGWNSVALTRPVIKQAVQTMLKASKSLATNRLDVAAPLQRLAYKDLAVTAQQLEQWLVDNRDQQRDALRPRLKEMLQEMLTRQQSETARTADLDALRPQGAWTNGGRQALAAVLAGEQEIRRIADKACDALVEDGSSVAFSGMLIEAREQLEKVIGCLEREETGPRVRDRQQEIERIFARLIVATEENRQTLVAKEMNNYVKPPRQGKPPPLISLGTELRLLKTQQEWINQQTAALRRAAPEALRPEQAEELRRLARQQTRVHEMTKDIIRRVSEWTP